MESATGPSVHKGQTQTNVLRGQVVYVYAFDLAYDTKRVQIPTILGCRTHSYDASPGKPGPRQGFFYRLQMVSLPAKRCQSSLGPMAVSEAVKLFNMGAISVQVCVPFEVSAIEDLVAYYRVSPDGRTVEGEVMQMAEQVRREFDPYFIRPVPDLAPGEDYTIFCIHQLPGPDLATPRRSEDWPALTTSFRTSPRSSATGICQDLPESLRAIPPGRLTRHHQRQAAHSGRSLPASLSGLDQLLDGGSGDDNSLAFHPRRTTIALGPLSGMGLQCVRDLPQTCQSDRCANLMRGRRW